MSLVSMGREATPFSSGLSLLPVSSLKSSLHYPRFIKVWFWYFPLPIKQVPNRWIWFFFSILSEHLVPWRHNNKIRNSGYAAKTLPHFSSYTVQVKTYCFLFFFRCYNSSYKNLGSCNSPPIFGSWGCWAFISKVEELVIASLEHRWVLQFIPHSLLGV